VSERSLGLRASNGSVGPSMKAFLSDRSVFRGVVSDPGRLSTKPTRGRLTRVERTGGAHASANVEANSSLQGGHILLKTQYGLVLAVPWWGTIGSPSVVHPAGPARPLKGITL